MTDLISRQAAIDAFEKELCDVREFAVGFVGAKRILESVPSAQPEFARDINVLSTETAERTAKTSQNVPNDDLISRKAAIEIASGFCHPANIAKELEQLPSVQPERKKARWILEPYSVENDTWVHRCGECLQFAMIGGGKPLFKYCPNCGAKMEVEE